MKNKKSLIIAFNDSFKLLNYSSCQSLDESELMAKPNVWLKSFSNAEQLFEQSALLSFLLENKFQKLAKNCSSTII